MENLTEEMQEAGQVRTSCLSAARARQLIPLWLALASQSTLYDDYRFVTRAELDRLGLTSAIGTAVLRPYMHGAWRSRVR